MKRIRIDLFVRALGELRVYPLRRDKETLKILKKAKGVYDTGLFYNDPSAPISYDTIYLADHDTNCITVTDCTNKDYTKHTRTEYPEMLSKLEVSFNDIIDYLIGINEGYYVDLTDDDVTEYDVPISYCKSILNAKLENNLRIPNIFKLIKEYSEKFIENREKWYYLEILRSYVYSLIKHSKTTEGAGCALMHWGCICKGEISYYLELEDDEEFDINKLHFFDSEDWWEDCSVCDDQMINYLEEHTVLVDFIEYDGRIITRSDSANIYKGYYNELDGENGKLIDEYMDPLDLKDFC